MIAKFKPFIITKSGKLTGSRFDTYVEAQTFLHEAYPLDRKMTQERYQQFCDDQPNIAVMLDDGTWTHDIQVGVN